MMVTHTLRAWEHEQGESVDLGQDTSWHDTTRYRPRNGARMSPGRTEIQQQIVSTLEEATRLSSGKYGCDICEFTFLCGFHAHLLQIQSKCFPFLLSYQSCAEMFGINIKIP
jgi:hypothetical protein